MAKFLLFCILFILCWPLALLALIAYPIVWLLLIPFRILGIAAVEYSSSSAPSFSSPPASFALFRSESHQRPPTTEKALLCALRVLCGELSGPPAVQSDHPNR